ncbi:type I restriction enzyme S subunit [Bacillus tianshenii]|uniref:Type I restriction enzyme S subunit n=1 Tax=Sutcliffiella tianshenii TaxID=1463404 RepID=A0ABS2NZW5_9BACI|nr:restriction endonuclease subunit S [Bacillus tianshenii]MBM7620169.1 type I restriction enzyme S subunit [Bacillus tianshenii]
MNNKIYEMYKKSGIDWLGDIPTHWNVSKVKNNYKFTTGFTPDTTKVDFYDYDNGYNWATISDLTKGTLGDTKSKISKEAVCKYKPEISKKGCLLYSFKLSLGIVKILDEDVYTNEAIATFIPNSNNEIGYLYYAAPIFIEKNCNLNIYGAKLLNQDLIKNAFILCPPKNEQLKIAEYLDIKCKGIDEIVQQKKLLIEVLQKYRQSLITETVTQGLNSNVKRKESGLDWIGQIPKHWDIKRLGFLGGLQNGISKSSEDFGFGYPFVSYGDVYKSIELPNEISGLVNSTRADRKTYSVEKGDIFFTRTSETVEEIGLTSTCLETVKDATFAGFLIRFRPTTDKLNPNYAKYFFRSNIHRKYFVKEMNIVTRASLGQELLKKIPVLLPPEDEQKKISEFLDSKCLQIDMLIEQNKQFIKQINLYKNALIFEAVTGKIDVRNFKKSELEVKI